MKDFLDMLSELSKYGFDILSMIVGALAIIMALYWKVIVKVVMERIKSNEQKENKEREQYSINTGQEINEILCDIAEKDVAISNVILCNYHNGNDSAANLSYFYFTSICEAFGNTTNQCFDIWREKSYLNFQPELKYIHLHRSAIINLNDPEDVEILPKFSKLVELSKTEMGLILPIVGISSNIGFVVILYKEAQDIKDRAGYIYNFSEQIERLAVIMNYTKKKFK